MSVFSVHHGQRPSRYLKLQRTCPPRFTKAFKGLLTILFKFCMSFEIKRTHHAPKRAAPLGKSCYDVLAVHRTARDPASEVGADQQDFVETGEKLQLRRTSQ